MVITFFQTRAPTATVPPCSHRSDQGVLRPLTPGARVPKVRPFMFETLTSGFRSARQRLQGLKTLDEATIDAALKDVRTSLLEADVEFGVVRDFTTTVREKALGEVIRLQVTRQGQKHKASPSEHFVKICYDALEGLMGPADSSIRFAPYGATKVLMVGLQGSGKTTTAAKLAKHAIGLKKKPILVAADVYRPAAIKQLQVLGEQLGVPVYAEPDCDSPQEICHRAIQFARANKRDFIIYDTAGRLTIDDALMQEIEDISRVCQPENTFLVVDAMIGQDAVTTAKSFNDKIDLSGIILTKLDGDARGGAALSIRQVTGKPIKFVGMGESLDRLDEFRPDGLAGRILGFGDIVGLMQDFEEVVDEEQAEADAERMLAGKFTMGDFLEQIQTLKKMGSLTELFDKLPFFPDGLPDGAQVDDGELIKIESLINSMTPGERNRPEIMASEPTRKKRIARGSGRKDKDVDELLFKFRMMKKMMKQLGSGGTGFLDNMPGIKQLKQMSRLSDGDMNDWFGADGGMDGGGPAIPQKSVRVRVSEQRSRAKSKRKMAKKSRKKGRKKR